MEGIRPTKEDLDYRIKINLDKGMTLEEIRNDTVNLMKDIRWLELRMKAQGQIYQDLIDHIDEIQKKEGKQ